MIVASILLSFSSWLPKGFSFILFALGILLFCTGIINTISRLRLSQNHHITNATIVNFLKEQQSRQMNSSTIHFPMIQYHASNQKEYLFTLRQPTTSFEIGDEITIAYHPRNPSCHSLQSTVDYFIPAIVGISFIICSGILFFFN